MTQEKRKTGRPKGSGLLYTQELADEICERIGRGETLTSICSNEHMPATRTVGDWAAAFEDFAASFARARVRGFDALADECIKIAEDGSNDWMERNAEGDGAKAWQLNGEHVQRSKLRVETRLKLLAKWDPKRYGDKLQQEHTGPGGGPVQVEEVRRTIVDPKA